MSMSTRCAVTMSLGLDLSLYPQWDGAGILGQTPHIHHPSREKSQVLVSRQLVQVPKDAHFVSTCLSMQWSSKVG